MSRIGIEMLIRFQGDASCIAEHAEGTGVMDVITFIQVEKQKCSRWLSLFFFSVNYRCCRHLQVIKRSEVFINEKVL